MTDSWRDRLSEYLDGELTAAEATALEAHLGECGACREELESLRVLVERLDTAPDREPARDLWPGLSRRLTAEEGVAVSEPRPSRRFAALRLAAALTGMAVLVGASWVWLESRSGDQSAHGSAPAVSADAGRGFADAGGAWKDLLAESALPEELAAPMRSELAAFERAIQETRAALAENPADTDLQSHLTTTLRAQMRFMSRLEEWAGGSS